MIELEQVTDLAGRPRLEENLAVNKSNTLYYPGSNLRQTRRAVRLDRLDRD